MFLLSKNFSQTELCIVFLIYKNQIKDTFFDDKIVCVFLFL